MAQIAWNMFDCFPADLASGIHDFTLDTFKVAFCTALPNSATHDELVDMTQIAATGGYTAGADGGYTITDATVVGPPFEFNFASVLSVGPSGADWTNFQYIVLYNASAPNDELISWYDYGSVIDLNDGDTIEINDVTSIFTINDA